MTNSTSSLESSSSAGLRRWSTRRLFLRELVGVYVLRRFSFLRGDASGVAGK